MSGERLVRFADWRRDRPFWGGIVLTLAGMVIAIVPLELAIRFSLVTNYVVFAGLLFAVPVALSGVFSIVRPQYAAYFGVVGIVFAIASVFGALGGFGVGTILGILGGSLCIAWVPDGTSDDPSTETESAQAEPRSYWGALVNILS